MRRKLALVLACIVFGSIVHAFITPIQYARSSPGLLTGTIYDQGIDEDGSGLFDYLQIRVEVNVQAAGYYSLSISGLATPDENATTAWVSDSTTAFLNTGLRIVSASFHGPAIYASRIEDASKIKSIFVSGQGFSDSMSDVSLSRSYNYTDFDAVRNNMEARFVVYPNGTVGLTGIVDAVRLPYVNKGPRYEESLNASRSGDTATISERGKITVPPEVASMWPFNATEVSALAEYSEGILTAGINSSVVLPKSKLISPYSYPYPYPYPFWQVPIYFPYTYLHEYPFNSSDFTFNLGFSNGILNGELDASSILPQVISSVFPFNVTDFTLEADYQNGLIKGNATFHILPGTAGGDLNLEFEGTRAHLTATGTLTVIYGTYPSYPKPIEINETVVDQLIAVITQLEGKGPDSLYNMTRGYLELDPATSIIKSPVGDTGVTLTFDLIMNGDLVALPLLFVFTANAPPYEDGEIAFKGMYRLLNSTLASINSASLQLSYAHVSKTALLKLKFVDDVEKLLTDLFKFPEDTLPLTFASGSMMPTLMVGDIVLIKNITSSSEISAAPYTGDIIAFYSPISQNDIIVHRAVAKVQVGGTWYFQTKGDSNYSNDSWVGPDTYNGMVSEGLVFGKVVERIPWVGLPLLYAGITPVGLRNKDYPTIIRNLLALVKGFSLKVSYKSANRMLDLKLSLAYDAKSLRDRVISELPDWIPRISTAYPWIESLLTKLLDNISAEVTSANSWLTYKNGEENHGAIVLIEGDLSRQVNILKEICISAFVEGLGQPPIPVPWHLYFFNQTEVDVDSMKFSFKMGETSLYASVEDVMVSPPLDKIDEDSFKLFRFFNLTAPTSPYQRESPMSGDQLRLTVHGGSNVTHAVTLSRPETVPQPDLTSLDRRNMTWFNQSISRLRDLVFTVETQKYGLTVLVTDQSDNAIPEAAVQIKWPNGTVFKSQTTNDYGYTDETVVDYATMPFGTYSVTASYSGVSNTGSFIIDHDGVYGISLAVKGPQVVRTITDPSLVTTANPFTIDAIDYASSVLVISQISKPVEIIIKNVTIPADVEPPPGTWTILGSCVEITSNRSDITVNATLRIYYTLEQLAAAGLDENTLAIHYWDANTGEWVKVDSNVNTADHCVWVNINHFSLWAIMGQQRTQWWTELWFLVLVISIAFVAAAAVGFYAIKRKRQTGSQSSLPKP